jgi:hypothetical protein
MNPILRNILAVVAGIVIGGAINMGIIMLFGNIIPPPDGVDPSDMESIKSNMHLYQPKHFISPFLAHALGTLIGAFTAAKIAISNHKLLALLIGGVFLIGGIMMVVQLPSPMWFNILDLVGAYIPMAWLGHKFANKG